jgi:hypothetical protein
MRLAFALVAASTLLAAALPASTAAAAAMVATYRGVVLGGVDNAGFFGAPGGDLSGAGFEATFVYDTGLGSRSTTVGHDYLAGGADVGSASPILTARLRIHGFTRTIGAGAFGQAISDSDYSSHRAFETADTPADDTDAETYLTAFLFSPAPGDLEAPWKTSFGSESMSGGFASFQRLDGATVVTDMFAFLSPRRLVIKSAAPEPATWALMLGGFGATGVAIRARRRRGLVAIP